MARVFFDLIYNNMSQVMRDSMSHFELESVGESRPERPEWRFWGRGLKRGTCWRISFVFGGSNYLVKN